MNNIHIRQITAAQTRPLRSELLRPFQRPDELVFNGDDAMDSLHLGAFLNDELVGIVSVSRDSMPGEDDPTVWKLRGMAVRPIVQGKGYGRALVESCLAHVQKHGGRLLWCSGRTSALGFYLSLGFEAVGEEYEVPGTGPHYRMQRVIKSSAT